MSRRIERSILSLVIAAGAATTANYGWRNSKDNFQTLEGVIKTNRIVSETQHEVENTAIIVDKILHPRFSYFSEPKDQPSQGRMDLVANLQAVEESLPDDLEDVRAQIRTATDNLAYKNDLSSSSAILNSVSKSIGYKEQALEERSSFLRYKIKEGGMLFYGGIAGAFVSLSSLIFGLRRTKKSPETPIKQIKSRELVKV